MVDIVFLGTSGAFPTRRRGTLSLLIEAPGFRMLVEAGPAIMQQLVHANLQVAEIEHLFVSHSHGDHTLGFPMLTLNRHAASSVLHIYAGRNTLDTLETLCTASYPGIGLHRLDNLNWHTLSEQGPDERELASGITLRTAVVPYPPGVPTLAARWDFAGGPSITFVTDTLFSTAAVELARDSDLLIHEASFSATLQPDGVPEGIYHSTARQAGEIARRAGCARLALVHLGPRVGEHPDVLAEEARTGADGCLTDLEVIVPEDGERLSVPA